MHQSPMDLNLTRLLFHGKEPLMTSSVSESGFITWVKNDSSDSTALRLDCLGFEANNTTDGVFPQSNCDLSSVQDDGCKLVLGLGPTPTSYCDDYATKTKESVSVFTPSSSSEADFEMLKLGLGIPIIDECSTSAKRISGGYMPSLLFAPRAEENVSHQETLDLFDIRSDSTSHRHQHQSSPEPSASTDSSIGCVVSDQHRAKSNHHHPKKCRTKGCFKGTRGASGHCIAHGGGQRCQRPGCNKGAESRTAFCKAHGGGRRCNQLGCTKSAEGRTDFCIAHGGGRRCSHHLGCTKAARGRSGLCIRHGGGKRCTIEGCTRSAEGQAGLCISHGGGKRCLFPECNKGAQGSTMHCKAHGGGKRCVFEGCTKGAEGSTPLCKGHGGGKRCLFEGGGVCPKSVHGGTNYCVAHGGGKRCAVPGCTKSARGRTDCCVRHGGGKRCRSEGCGKSAQGSTDYCKAHGGGKRCSFGGCDKFARGRSGLCAAHASMTMVSKNGGGGMVGSGLFRGIVLSTSAAMTTTLRSSDQSSSGLSVVSDCAESAEIAGRQQLLIPSQVLVPVEMKADLVDEGVHKGSGFVIPEGRVHGGGLMSLLGGSIRNAVDGGRI